MADGATSDGMPGPNTSGRLPTVLAACAISAGFALLLLTTSPRLPLVWDEGDTILRAEKIADAWRNAGADLRPNFLSAVQSTEVWEYTTVREGHPPLVGIVIALGTAIAPPWLDPLTQARLGPILLFAAAAGVMFYRLQRDYRAWPVSVTAVAVLATMPRVFAHAHFATLDAPLTACWVLTWAAFGPACRDWRFIPLFGAAMGLTLTAKFTGWLVVVPFAAWAWFYRDRAAARAIAIAVPIAIAVFLVLNPPFWTHPVIGLYRFFELNLTRGSRHYNISTQFFGRMYNLDHPLPWYNALVWVAITVNPMTLVFGAAGIVTTLRRWRGDPLSTMLVCQWATLVIVRTLPFAPPHDAERLILPSFAFFAALVGVGIGRALYRGSLVSEERIVAQGWAKVAMAIVLVTATFDAVSYFPHNLSYYSRLIGGLRGATALGMEPIYYWDALDRETLGWLAANTPPGKRIVFAAAPPRNLALLARWGLLEYHPDDERPIAWYVVQRRPSAWRTLDRWLVEHDKPALERSFAGVPLLDVYSYDDVLRARVLAPRPGKR